MYVGCGGLPLPSIGGDMVVGEGRESKGWCAGNREKKDTPSCDRDICIESGKAFRVQLAVQYWNPQRRDGTCD